LSNVFHALGRRIFRGIGAGSMMDSNTSVGEVRRVGDSTAQLQPASHSCLQALGDDLRGGGTVF
jgi:hypothetical protein